ncbi:type II secretion system F family protein [Ideonella sp. 4Y16]|uniref:type II secretion system F family protein n=1 Tax=Ideonella alba TaxID=2824118 RepID=UPI001B39147D|nr:type II secretion system F family protein [Ideonella alba]MBQ0945570.1 type II secretion system F family protein [Ideonella alba]
MTHPLTVSVLGGLALVLLLIAAWGLYTTLGRADATYRDKPPPGFRVLWPLINILGNSVATLLTPGRRQTILTRLRRAGQEYALTPEQLIGGQLLSALLAGLLAQWLLDGSSLAALLGGGLLGWYYPDLWLKDHTQRRRLAVLKAMPYFLDIVTLAIEAGLNLTGALQKAVDRSKPGPLMSEINRVLRDIRAGKPRVDALRDLAERMDFAPVSSLVSALVQGELMGSSLGPVLRAQSDQRRTERFQRAEKLAMEAPVKMLGPLILFIFPCTFIVLGFPIVMKFLSAGL